MSFQCYNRTLGSWIHHTGTSQQPSERLESTFCGALLCRVVVMGCSLAGKTWPEWRASQVRPWAKLPLCCLLTDSCSDSQHTCHKVRSLGCILFTSFRSLTTLFQLPPGALERAVLNVEINTKEMIGICTRKLKFLVLKVQNTSRRPEKTFPFAFRFPTDIDGCIQSARASYTKVTVLSQDGLYEASCRRSF